MSQLCSKLTLCADRWCQQVPAVLLRCLQTVSAGSSFNHQHSARSLLARFAQNLTNQLTTGCTSVLAGTQVLVQ
jgi:hypothetical protein